MFKEDIPILVIFAGMGLHYLDMALGWIGREHAVLEKFTLSVDEFLSLNISKKEEALQYMATRLKTGITSWGAYKRTKTAEVTQILVGTLLSHVPVTNGCFDDKAAFLSYMVRRCILAEKDSRLLDDRDHFGVKRLQLAGNILQLVFEDVIKSLNTELKTRADKNMKVCIVENFAGMLRCLTLRLIHPLIDWFDAWIDSVLDFTVDPINFNFDIQFHFFEKKFRFFLWPHHFS